MNCIFVTDSCVGICIITYHCHHHRAPVITCNLPSSSGKERRPSASKDVAQAVMFPFYVGSICNMKRNTHVIVPKSRFKLLSGQDNLSCYQVRQWVVLLLPVACSLPCGSSRINPAATSNQLRQLHLVSNIPCFLSSRCWCVVRVNVFLQEWQPIYSWHVVFW